MVGRTALHVRHIATRFTSRISSNAVVVEQMGRTVAVAADADVVHEDVDAVPSRSSAAAAMASHGRRIGDVGAEWPIASPPAAWIIVDRVGGARRSRSTHSTWRPSGRTSSAIARPLPIVSPGVCPAPTTIARAPVEPSGSGCSCADVRSLSICSARCQPTSGLVERTGCAHTGGGSQQTHSESPSAGTDVAEVRCRHDQRRTTSTRRTHDHDEFDRGLAHDLQTMMNRRRMLFTVGGAGLGALVLAACGSGDGDRRRPNRPVPDGIDRIDGVDGGAAAPRPPATARHGRDGDHSGDGRDSGDRMRVGDPRRDRRALPRRRDERRERAHRGRHRAQRHHVELRIVDHDDRRHPARAGAHDPGRRRRARRCRARPCTSGTAPRRASTRCTRARSPTRTSCAACRSPMPTARSGSRPSCPAATTAVGRTCTSRSSTSCPTPCPATTASRRPSSPSPRPSPPSCTPTRGTRAAPATSPGSRSTSDMVFADDGGAQQLASMSGDNDAGYRAQLTVGI